MLKEELRKILLSLNFVFVAAVSYVQYVVTRRSDSPVKATRSSGNSTGRLEVYLMYGMDSVTISYISSFSFSHQWYRYKAKRSEAEKVTSTRNGTTSTIWSTGEGYGCFVEERAVSRYVRIVDCGKCTLNIPSPHISDNSDPYGGLALAGIGTIQPIYYCQPNTGTKRELSRQFGVTHNALEYDLDKKECTSKQEMAVIEGNLFGKSIPTPWYDTEVCVKGDYLAHHFRKEVTLCTDEYQTAVIDARIGTLLIEREAPDMGTMKSGHYAPAAVQLSAIADTPTAVLFDWKIRWRGKEDNPVARLTGEEVDYTFDQSGTFIIKLKVSDQSTACSIEDEAQIDIPESYLTIPNAFSPGTTSGINDGFRVAYKSLVKFKAWISNRQGPQMYYQTDPAQGQDGKKGGKYAQSDVHSYVIEAGGSDSIKCKEGSDINILRPKAIQDENESVQE